MTPERGHRRTALRRRLQRCLGLATSPANANAPASPPSAPQPASLSYSWSDTEVLTPMGERARSRRRRSADSSHSPLALLQSPRTLRAAACSPSSEASESSESSADSADSTASRASGASKGVQYDRGGGLLCCRFCDILRARSEPFLYEDAELAVFRPLSPAVDSHILVVPRCHIRNVNQLTGSDSPLLERMRQAAKQVLRDLPPSKSSRTGGKRLHAQTSSSSSGSTSSLPSPTARGVEKPKEADQGVTRDVDHMDQDADRDVGCKLAFHTPPFNSIDHVHMHAFRTDQQSFFGCVGAIKYRTATWWCRSFDEVMARLDATAGAPHRRNHQRRVARRAGRHSRPHASAPDDEQSTALQGKVT